VKPNHVARLLHLNDWKWAGATLKVTEGLAPGSGADQPTSQAALDTKSLLELFLSSRYDESATFLDLSAIEQDPVIRQMGVTEITSDSAKSKFFPALMKVCDLHFDNAEKKRKAVPSISLANNNLTSVAPVTTLSQTFPDLKNLDLFNNQIADTRAFNSWRWKFRHLDHLIISGNPIENTDYQPTLLKWFPKLRLINHQVVRTPKQLAAADGKLPLAILAANFKDEAGIAELLIKNFFPAFDTDRASIANAYYDNQSTFSLSVNTSAPRASDAEVRGVGWDPYIKHSRNLLKITHLPSRMSRTYTGVAAIREIWANLPKTKHPDLMNEFSKWNIECHSIPGLPDPINASAGGVGGLVITVHGQFEEITANNLQNVSQRSFDRTFVLGPGTTPVGVRVISDIICLRAWGGFEAWLPNPDGTTAPTHPEATNGLAVPELQKSTEQLLMEKMILEFSQKTNLNLQYARLCLESAQWNPERALGNFTQSKVNLPSISTFMAY
jgi:nuclear RNA export factor